MFPFVTTSEKVTNNIIVHQNQNYTCDRTKQLHKNTDLLVMEKRKNKLPNNLDWIAIYIFHIIGAKLKIKLGFLDKSYRWSPCIEYITFYTVRIKCV